jgi:hypothetical protein
LLEATSAKTSESAVVPAVGERSWESAYTICVDAAEGQNAVDRYALSIRSFTPEGPFEFEPNDTQQTRSALPRETPVHGYLTLGDVDWFELSAGSPEAEIRVEAPAGVALEVVLLDRSGFVLTQEQGKPGKSVTLVHPGVAFVKVRALSGENVKDRYQITATAPDPVAK